MMKAAAAFALAMAIATTSAVPVRKDRKDYAPCEGKRAGERCTVCSPFDRGCLETAVIKTCDADGNCAAGGPSPAECTLSNGEKVRAGWKGKDDCNTCSCSDEGLLACTKMACRPEKPEQRPEKPEQRPEYSPCEGKRAGERCTVCSPFDRSCLETAVIKTCDADGNCAAGGPSPAECTLSNGEKVRAGWKGKDDCNTCSCSDEGLLACTQMACIPQLTAECTLSNGEKVRAGWKGKDDCNTCSCSDEGLLACTKMACPEKPEPRTKQPCKDRKPEFCKEKLANLPAWKVERRCKRTNIQKKCQASCGLQC